MRNGIAPLNFLALIPLWSIPLATVTGNTLLLKPSGRDPGAAMIIAELCKRAGATERSFLFAYLDSDGALE
jgi:acyl-CoA reductase-like NAD-dependent aldehyde dehydrogenase